MEDGWNRSWLCCWIYPPYGASHALLRASKSTSKKDKIESPLLAAKTWLLRLTLKKATQQVPTAWQ